MTRRISAYGTVDVCYNKDGTIEKVIPVEEGSLGQGVGFKSLLSFDEAPMDEVLYVPEYGWKEEADSDYRGCDFFTKRSFLEITSKNPENPAPWEYNLAWNLYNQVDWQYPETLFDEWEMDGEILSCKHCGTMENPEAILEAFPETCPVCGRKLDY